MRDSLLCSASTFEFDEPPGSDPARRIWENLVKELSEGNPATYLAHGLSSSQLILAQGAELSPDRKLVRRRALRGVIRRSSGKASLLDISLGNLFLETERPREKADLTLFPASQIWINKVQKISVAEHVNAIEMFLGNAKAQGWAFQPARLERHKFEKPIVRNGEGEFALNEHKIRDLLMAPLSVPSPKIEFLVGCKNLETARLVADRLARAMERLLARAKFPKPTIRFGRNLSPSAVNLWILPEAIDLMRDPETRQRMSEAESRRLKFKLARIESTSNIYALQNMVYDMLIIGGLVPYVLGSGSRDFCSVDAGHSAVLKKSRWVCSETQNSTGELYAKVFDTELAEHIPSRIHEDLWPKTKDAIFCRDGKFSKEGMLFRRRAKADGQDLIECKKHPLAVMWMPTQGSPIGCSAGQCLVDPHGEMLLQSISLHGGYCVRPVRLSIQGRDPLRVAEQFYHHGAWPGLSLTNASRLPGSLYFSDLISKLTGSGWTKIVGRGWGLSELIP